MTPTPARAGAELFRRRLEGYTEYARLLEEQERAAEAGDLDRVSELGARLDVLQAALGDFPSGPDRLPEGDTEGARLRAEAVEVLERAARTQKRVVERLREARNVTRDEIRRLDGRSRQVRSYLDDAPADGGRVNVRF